MVDVGEGVVHVWGCLLGKAFVRVVVACVRGCGLCAWFCCRKVLLSHAIGKIAHGVRFICFIKSLLLSLEFFGVDISTLAPLRVATLGVCFFTDDAFFVFVCKFQHHSKCDMGRVCVRGGMLGSM